MKRVGGNVTWKAKLDRRFLDGIRSGEKRQVIQKVGYVEDGDALVLAGPTGEEFMEVTVESAVSILIRTDEIVDKSGRRKKTLFIRLDGKVLDRGGMHKLACADGFSGVAEMLEFMRENDMFMHGIFDGQLIRW